MGRGGDIPIKFKVIQGLGVGGMQQTTEFGFVSEEEKGPDVDAIAELKETTGGDFGAL